MTGEVVEAVVVDTLTLTFRGDDGDAQDLQVLSASHLAEVLQGLVGLTSDFSKAGAFGEGPAGGRVLVRPVREGSFVMDVVRVAQDNPYITGGGAISVPTLAKIIWWSTRSARAEVEDFEHLENGNVKVTWQDATAEEVPLAAWQELNKRKRRRKKQLREIMAPLSDAAVSSLEVGDEDVSVADEAEGPDSFLLEREDYDAVRPDDEIEEKQDTFVTEAQMSAIDFDDPTRWRVKTPGARGKLATVEDQAFLTSVADGLAIRKTDIFNLRIREDAVKKNGRTRRAWIVLHVISHRRAAHDDDA